MINKEMKRTQKNNDIITMTAAVAIVFSFVVLAFISTLPTDLISRSQDQSSVYAGTQEAIDSTISPRATALPRISPSPTIPSVFIDDGFDEIPTATPFSFPSPTFNFDNLNPGTENPQLTPTPLPTFQLNLPGDGNTQPQPSPTEVAATVRNNNTPLIIIGVVVGVVILLAVIGFILLKKSKDNNPPPTFPGGLTPNYPTQGGAPTSPQQMSGEPQYPPYINQQG